MALPMTSNRRIVFVVMGSAVVTLLLCGTLHRRLDPTSAPAAADLGVVDEVFEVSLMQHQHRIISPLQPKADGLDLVEAAAPVPAVAESDVSTGGMAMLRGTMFNATMKAVEDAHAAGGSSTWESWIFRIAVQLIFGAMYYCVIVSKYPTKFEEYAVTAEAKALQNKDEINATCDTSCPNNFHAFCCSGPRAAHTFHSVGLLDYWAGCILMTLFPCCTLWLTNSCTDLNEKLGGEKRGFCMGCLCACLCSCCVIAQDAQTLDLITGAKTELFSVKLPPSV